VQESNTTYYSDDPDDFDEDPQRRKLPALLAFLLLLVGGTYFVQTTLAANINLNSGPVEFGQGVTKLVACDDEVKVTPISSFVNSEGGGSFKFSSLTLSGLDGTDQENSSDKGCAGRTFTIKSYDSNGNLLDPIYSISLDGNGNFSSTDGETQGTREGETNSSVTLIFATSSIDAGSVSQVTIETGKTEVSLIFQGPLTGEYAEVGLTQLAAARFAISRFNSQNGNYIVKLILVDDQGSGTVAPGVVSQVLAEHPEVIGVIGPGFSPPSITSVPLYRTAGLVMLATTASVERSLTDPSSGNYGVPVFHRLISIPAAHGMQMADYAKDGIGSPKVYLVDDGEQRALNLRNPIAERLGSSLIVGSDSIQPGVQDYSAISVKVLAAESNSVIYLGEPADAARFITSLRNTGYTGLFTVDDFTENTSFLTTAGLSAEGTRLISVWSKISDIAPQLFSEFNVFPGTSDSLGAPLAIDATNIFLEGIASGNLTRSSMLSWVDSYSGTGIGGESISFDQHGDRNGVGSLARYVVDGGSYVYVPE
jgi:branched-chain amino acid transport system substrate-binding protein